MNDDFEVSLVSPRSFEPLEDTDLERLAELAIEDLNEFFTRRPETAELYRDRLMMLCLCQGGAEHFVRHRRGVKDLDVWAFFSEHPARPFPYRRRGIKDFGPSRLGRHPDDDGFEGRRVDIIGRSIKCAPEQPAREALKEWLRAGKTTSARLIAQRPVIAIHPADERGSVLWDPSAGRLAGRAP